LSHRATHPPSVGLVVELRILRTSKRRVSSRIRMNFPAAKRAPDYGSRPEDLRLLQDPKWGRLFDRGLHCDRGGTVPPVRLVGDDSGARRLRADGLGVMLSANELGDVADWYLLPKGDIRSSYALEVAANKYTELPPPPFPLFERYCLANPGPDRVRLTAFEQIFGANQQVRPGGLGLSGMGGPACPNWILKAAVGDWRPKRNQVSC
jgi:hypothetical protein